MNEIYQNMLSAYDCSTEQQRRNAVFEVNQQIALAGLYLFLSPVLFPLHLALQEAHLL